MGRLREHESAMLKKQGKDSDGMGEGRKMKSNLV